MESPPAATGGRSQPISPCAIRPHCGGKLETCRHDEHGCGIAHGHLGYTSIFHGLRISRLSILFASSSSKRSLTGSHLSFFPVRSDMTPMWQTLTERWPTSAVQMVGLRVLMHSRKLPI